MNQFYALILGLALTCAACASVGQTVTIDGVPMTFEERSAVYRGCGLAAGLSGVAALQLVTKLEGQPTEDRVEQGLASVLGSTIPAQAIGACGRAVHIAKAAIRAGKAMR